MATRSSAKGRAEFAGFAKGSADVRLSDKDGGTLLSYSVDAQIGGKLAQLGQRLINGAAKKMAEPVLPEIRRCGREWLTVLGTYGWQVPAAELASEKEKPVPSISSVLCLRCCLTSATNNPQN